MRTITIGHLTITQDTEPFIVAEIGHNHCGDMEKARRLIYAAYECGCNAVKFQKRTNKLLYTKELYDSPYINPNSYGATYGEHREALEFDVERHKTLRQWANSLGLIYFSTAFDHQALKDIVDAGTQAIKIASGDLANIPLIRAAGQTGLPVIVSTGGWDFDYVIRAHEELKKHAKQHAFLHCTAIYPTPPDKVNLRSIEVLQDLCPDIIIGFSDHYNGTVMSIGAYMRGARIIEKHFTLDHTWKGTDHALSLQPDGMRRMVRDIKRLKEAMKPYRMVKEVYHEETPALKKMGKYLYTAREVFTDNQIVPEDLITKSPGGNPPYDNTGEGFVPLYQDELCTYRWRHHLWEGELILPGDIWKEN